MINYENKVWIYGDARKRVNVITVLKRRSPGRFVPCGLGVWEVYTLFLIFHAPACGIATKLSSEISTTSIVVAS